MAKRTFTIILDDDTQIKNLELNGNCYISSSELKEADIKSKLSKVSLNPPRPHGRGQQKFTKIGSAILLPLEEMIKDI